MTDLTRQRANPFPTLARFAQTRPLTLFFLISYSWTWTVWLVVPRVIRHSALGRDFDSFFVVLIIVGVCGPTVAAFITRWLSHRDARICPAWTGSRNMIIGLAVGLAGFFLATVVAPACAVVKAPFLALHWSSLLHSSIYRINYSTFFGGPVTEEPGWRGFALPRLQARYGPFWATVILAALWAAWHMPLFQVPGWSSASPWQFVLILLGASFLLTAAANLAKFGVIVAILLHAFFNTSSKLVNGLAGDLPSRTHVDQLYAFAVFASGAAFGIAVLTWQKGRGGLSKSEIQR